MDILSMPASFELDSRLQNDTEIILETDSLLYLLMNDSRYPWIILVPKVSDMAELHDLNDADYNHLMAASRQLGISLMSLFDGYKLNVAAIGNVVRQLHLHHVVRQQEDFAWPNPVWGQGKPEPYSKPDRQALLEKLHHQLLMQN